VAGYRDGDGRAMLGDDLVSLRQIERAAARSWPAIETADVDGWLARASSGGSVRANSVSALDWHGSDLDASIARVIGFYGERCAIPRFTITEVDQPKGLDAALEARGWRAGDEHVTMAKEIAGPAAITAPEGLTGVGSSVIRHDIPTEPWLGVYLEGLTPSRRAVAPRLVAGVPSPRAFFSCLRDGETVGSGLTVLDGSLASVQCMATIPTARRSGVAQSVLAAIEAWARSHGARRLYLQAEGGNIAAVSLYARIGFTIVGRYHTRELSV
jgi:N-acetylglutamate synthase